MYKLKPSSPEFEVVDGPLAGRKFKRGEVYAEVPPQYADRFDPTDRTLKSVPKEGAKK